MTRFISFICLAGLVGLGTFWLLTRPEQVDASALDGILGDAAAGQNVFRAAGCASCHSAPGASGGDKLVLAGGRAFPSEFGTFYAPNISPDPAGIADWSVADLANALIHGTSPDGSHYYPAFPYTSYRQMTLTDVADLSAYLSTLPASQEPSRAHDVGFPFSIRRSLGGWKFLFLRDGWVETSPASERGRYLVEGPGHCGECHTPRNLLGGLDYDNWLAGAPNPAGPGTIPSLRPASLGWSEGDIVFYLQSGVRPDFDSAGGEMVDVIDSLSGLPQSDLEAIAAYLVGLSG